MSRFADPSEAVLTKIEFNQECSLENDFVRGLDTRTIVKVFLSYIKNNYPYVKRIRFSDASYRTCDSGQNVELPEMSYVVYGKTWYERTFGAYLSETDKSTFDTASAEFQALKPQFTWDMMESYIGTDSPYKTLYESSETWYDFFGAIQNELGAAEFCGFLAPWLHTFMMRHMKFQFPSMTYFINVGLDFPYKEEPYVKGGRSTRRRYKRARGRDEQ